MNNIALITGGAKRIGREIALALAANNYDIALHYNNSKTEAEETAHDITQEGQKVFCVQADLSNHDEVSKIFSKINGNLGIINVLVNNASVFLNDNLEKMTTEIYNKNMQINLYAPLLLSQGLYKQLPDGIFGNIINMLDYSVWRPPLNFLSYNISKSGLWAATQHLALQLAPKIRVNAIGPGNALPNTHETLERFAKACNNSPLQIGTSTAEICNAILFLLNSPSITGQMLALDSGKHLVGAEGY